MLTPGTGLTGGKREAAGQQQQQQKQEVKTMSYAKSQQAQKKSGMKVFSRSGRTARLSTCALHT
jgi:hypothetical protein